MSSQTIQFSTEVKNLKITSGKFSIQGIVSGYVGTAYWSDFTGDTFTGKITEDESDYFAVTVLVYGYTINGEHVNVPSGKPINLVATFYAPDLTADSVVKVCPESAISSIYTFARMTTVQADGLVTMNGTSRNMKIAYGMKQNFWLTEGGVAEMIQKSPNGFETNSYSMFNSLCNLFYYCLRNPETSSGQDFYDQFKELAYQEVNKPNTTFLEAVRNMLYDPFCNAEEIYNLLKDLPEIYKHSLISMKLSDEAKIPTNWTLTLKNNESGAKNFIPAGLAFVVFDINDNAWVANNFRAGSGDSGTHCPVYKYNAKPTDFSPVQGGGLLGVAFGVAVNNDKTEISFGNFGWGSEYNNPQQGSISRFGIDGKPISSSNGYTLGLSRVQGMEYDTSGNLWMASVGCQEPFAPAPVGDYPFTSEPSGVVVYLKGDPTDPDNVVGLYEFPIMKSSTSKAVTKPTSYLKVFDVTPDNKGNAFVSCIGNYDKDVADNCALSAVYKVSLVGNKLTVIASWYSDFQSPLTGQIGYESLRQVAIDGDGNAVVVGVTGSRATVLNGSDLSFKCYYDTNTYAPWGVKIDKKQTVFLANFGHNTGSLKEGTLDLAAPFGVTMLRNPSDPTSAKLLTVPTGGEEVMLANGHPLYGTQTRPGPMELVDGEPTYPPIRMKSYQPIMRLTSTNIDGAGNLWCMNNWKPSAIIDAVIDPNPGGDGVVIFLGIAEPE
jgi:hypothetical protein